MPLLNQDASFTVDDKQKGNTMSFPYILTFVADHICVCTALSHVYCTVWTVYCVLHTTYMNNLGFLTVLCTVFYSVLYV